MSKIWGRSYSADRHRKSCSTLQEFKIGGNDEYGVYALMAYEDIIDLLDDEQFGSSKGTFGWRLSQLHDVITKYASSMDYEYNDSLRQVEDWKAKIRKKVGGEQVGSSSRPSRSL